MLIKGKSLRVSSSRT